MVESKSGVDGADLSGRTCPPGESIMHKSTNQSVLALSATLAMIAGSASAHITLLNPNGGETLTFGDLFSMEWRIDIAHNQQNWDLWYSTEGPTGGWVEIAMDLAPGATNPGSIHSFDWTIPEVLADEVWVRVRMDNAGTDYFDVSNASFSIVPAPGMLSFLAIAPIAGLRRRTRR